MLKLSSEFASNQKLNKSNVKRFDKFDKIKAYNVDENVEDEFEKDFFNQDDVDVDDHYVENYHALKDIFYYQSSSYNDFENEDDNVVYLITLEMLLFESNKLIICKKCDNNFSSNNKLHDHIRFVCSSKNIFVYFTNVSSKSFSIIMTTQNSKSTVITRSSAKKFDATASSSIASSEFTTILSKTSKSFSINTSIFLREFKFTFVSIIVSNVDFNKNVDIDHDFRD